MFGIWILLFAGWSVNGVWAGTETYTYRYDSKIVSVPIHSLKVEGKVDGSELRVRVNDVCVKSKARCQGLRAFQGPSRVREIKHVVQENEAGAYCEVLGATQLFLQRPSGESDLFCVFKDLTMVDGRALFNLHVQKLAPAPEVLRFTQ